MKSGGNLAKLYDKVIATKTEAVIDFKPYLPANNTPAFFVGLPVFRSDNKLTAVLAVRLSTNKINEIMRGNFDISRTGEMYLVGPDNLMRSTSLHNPINYSVKASFAGIPEKNGIITKASYEALAGATGTKLITSYTGNTVISAYTPVKIHDITWALLAEIDQTEAFASITDITLMIKAALCVALVVSVFIPILATRTLSQKFAAKSNKFHSLIEQLKLLTKKLSMAANKQDYMNNQLSDTANQIIHRYKLATQQQQKTTTLHEKNTQTEQKPHDPAKKTRAEIEKVVQYIRNLEDKSRRINTSVEIMTELLKKTNTDHTTKSYQADKLTDSTKKITRDIYDLIDEMQKATCSVISFDDTVKNI